MNGIVQHVVGEELVRLKREKAVGAQQHAIQKAVNAMQDLHVAWNDLTSTTCVQNKPLLDEDVVFALKKLVKVSKQTFLLSITHINSLIID